MIRVLVAEDMRILRETLVSVLNLEDDIKVVAQVAADPDIVPAALAERPDLAVLDIDLPGIDGITAAARLHERLPACRVVILTVLGRPGQLRAASVLGGLFHAVRAYLPYAAATTLAGARIGYSMFQSGTGASAGTPLPFAAAAALLAGLAILFCVVAARTTVARDVS